MLLLGRYALKTGCAVLVVFSSNQVPITFWLELFGVGSRRRWRGSKVPFGFNRDCSEILIENY